jgi:protein TorT
MISRLFAIFAVLVASTAPAAAQLEDSLIGLTEAPRAPIGMVPLDAWYPRLVESRQPPFFGGGVYTRSGYIPLERAAELWEICASVPPTSFDYFEVIARGLEAEALRLGVSVRLQELQTFDREEQLAHFAQCMEEEADAIVVVAIAEGGFDEIFVQARERGIPVIDLATGSGSRNVTARIVTDRVGVGRAAGQFLSERHPLGGDLARVVWLYGPAGTRIARDEDLGLRTAIETGALEVVLAQEVDLEDAAVRPVIQDILDSGLEFEALVGGSLTAQIATEEFAGRFPPGTIEVISVTTIPATISGIAADRIFAAVNDQPVVQARIAVDLAVRAIEGRPFLADIRPAVEIIDRSNVETFDRSTVMPPQ